MGIREARKTEGGLEPFWYNWPFVREAGTKVKWTIIIVYVSIVNYFIFIGKYIIRKFKKK